jgi:hypothetical protein
MTHIYLLDNNFPDPSICYYYSYVCSVCERLFLIIDPYKDFTVGGITVPTAIDINASQYSDLFVHNLEY